MPFSSTALIGVAPHDAGVASALVNATQQVGGSLGTALLNTVAASATASYLLAHNGNPAFSAQALVHGYTVGFTVSASILLVAVVVAGSLVGAGRGDLPARGTRSGPELSLGAPRSAAALAGGTCVLRQRWDAATPYAAAMQVTPTTTVAYLGPEGTFTEEALVSQADLAGADRLPFGSFRDVLDAVDKRTG